MLNYCTQINPKDVLIIFFDELNIEKCSDVAKQVCIQYKLNLILKNSIDDVIKALESSNFKITHFIVRTKSPFDINIVEKLRGIPSNNYISGSVAFSYRNAEESLTFEKEINEEKKIYGNLSSFNIMRPDVYHDELFIVSNTKLTDNIICDTIRIKYKAKCLNQNSVLAEMPKFVKEFFLKSAEYYDKNQMYHRSNTDGYFAIKTPDGIYITATKTEKDKGIDLNRVSLIKNYNRKDNEIEYLGQHLPSSDSVEACVIFENLPHITQIIHTHDSISFTRNKNAEIFPRVHTMRYGEADLGDEIVKIYQKTLSQTIILEEHGEVFLGSLENTSFWVIDESLKKINKGHEGEN